VQQGLEGGELGSAVPMLDGCLASFLSASSHHPWPEVQC
jgi:hypothetical protein